MLDTILLALCLVLFIESLGPLLFPNRWKQFLQQIANEPAATIRQIGMVLFVIGAVGIFLLR